VFIVGKWKTRNDPKEAGFGKHYEMEKPMYPYGARRRGSGAAIPPQNRSVDAFKKPAAPWKSTSTQWDELSVEQRKRVMDRANLNEKWAQYDFDDLPEFVRKDLYRVTAGTHPGWKKPKENPGPGAPQFGKIESEAARFEMAKSVDHIEVPKTRSIPVGSVRVKKVELLRAEGFTDDPTVGRWMTFDSVEEANAQLRENLKTSSIPPGRGGYEKHDFKVTFTDGSVYTGRYDLHRDEHDADIGRQMHSFSKYVMKTDSEKFPHITKQYRWNARHMFAITDPKHLKAEPKPKPESLASLEKQDADYWKGMNEYIEKERAAGKDEYEARVRYARAHGKKRDLKPYIYRTTIGHYGGLYVVVPEEKFEGFKAHFPAKEFPRKVETKDFNDPQEYHVGAIKRYQQKFPQFSGRVKEVFFADRSKGLRRLNFYDLPHSD
jgi:hypothetical protein